MVKIRRIKTDVYGFRCPGCGDVHVVPTGSNEWTFDGDLNHPTFTPSIFAKSTMCHSFVTNGYIRYLDDSAHNLAGKTVELPDIVDDHF